MDSKTRLLLAGLLLGAALARAPEASADAIEVSLGVSYNRSNYAATSYTWERRWGATFGYHFSDRSEVELAFQDIINRNYLAGLEDTRFHDQIYSLNWVQSLTGKGFPVQPYFKLGVGQLNREATGSYAGGGVPPKQVDSVTGVLGLGARVYITRTMGIRAELTSYLSGGSIRTYKDNLSYTVGVSLYF